MTSRCGPGIFELYILLCIRYINRDEQEDCSSSNISEKVSYLTGRNIAASVISTTIHRCMSKKWIKQEDDAFVLTYTLTKKGADEANKCVRTIKSLYWGKASEK